MLSIRINTIKTTVKYLKTKLNLKKRIPWCKQGFYVKEINKQLHKKGYFYIQNPITMLPPILLNPKPTDIVLDLCAAPGGKTTHIASIMKNKGIIIANDKKTRIKSLITNLQTFGVINTIVTQSKNFNSKIKFNKILLDAPCSGTAKIKPKIKKINKNILKKLSKTQKFLIKRAFSLLKKHGTLLYCTCSLEPEENEEIINYLLKTTNARLLKIKTNIKTSKVILKHKNKIYSNKLKNCIRIYPSKDIEGIFIAKIKK